MATALVHDDCALGLLEGALQRFGAVEGGDEGELLGAVEEHGARPGGQILERHDPGNGVDREAGAEHGHGLDQRGEGAEHVGVPQRDEGHVLARVEEGEDGPQKPVQNDSRECHSVV